jgi:hypothetical protein
LEQGPFEYAHNFVQSGAPSARRRPIAPFVWGGVIVLVVVVAVGGYLAAGLAAAAGDRRAAEAVVEKARVDNNQISGRVTQAQSLPSPLGGAQNLAQVKAGVDVLESQIKRADQTVVSDLPSLRQSSAALLDQEGSVLVLLQRGALNQERSRVDAVVTAFSAADACLKVASDQMTFVSSMLDAEMAMLSATQHLNDQDITGAVAAFPAVNAKMQQAVTLSRGKDIPPQLQTLMSSLSTLSADMTQFVQAVQAKDQRAVQTLSTKIDADANATANFDQQGFDAFETQLFKPYQDRYEKALRQVGFTVTA